MVRFLPPMNFILPCIIALAVLAAFVPLPGGHPISHASQEQRLDSVIEVVRERIAVRRHESINRAFSELMNTLRSKRNAASKAYEAAARVRQDHEIIDSDPETAGVTIPVSTRVRHADADSIVEEYRQLKKAYVEAKAELMEAEQKCGSTDCGPMGVLYIDAKPLAAKATDAFDELTKLLQRGKIRDPNPDDPKSAVLFDPKDKDAADEYAKCKATYLALKERIAKLRGEHRIAVVNASRADAFQAYQAAARVRQKSKITDPDPERADAIVSPKEDPNALEYLRFKNTHLAAKAEIEMIDAFLPINLLQTELDTAEKEAIEAFTKVTRFFQGGKVTDPKPDDPHSAVSFEGTDQEIATAYIEQKATYLAFKNRSTRAQKALAAAKARRTQ